MKSKLTGIFGLLIGVTIGAVLGILFAPHKGSVTRAKMKNQLDMQKEKAEEKAIKTKQRMRKISHEKMADAKSRLFNIGK